MKKGNNAKRQNSEENLGEKNELFHTYFTGYFAHFPIIWEQPFSWFFLDN